MRRIVIIGGGITGLAAAHRMLERTRQASGQVHLTLLESGPRLGGIVQTEEHDGFLLERGPDSFISEKPEALELARRLDLESHLIETNSSHRRSFVVRQGRLLPVPEGFHLLAPTRFWPFVTSDIFSWPAKARIAMELLLPRRNVNGSAEESLAQFVRRRLGREALERMAQPMVGGIYTGDPEKLSLRAIMPRFLEMEYKHRSLIRAMRRPNGSPTRSPGGKLTPGSQAVQPGWGETVGENSAPENLIKAEEDLFERRAGITGDSANGLQASGPRYSLFLSFDRGMQLLTDKLAERISKCEAKVSNSKSEIADSMGFPQPSIRVNTAVESLNLNHETVTPNDAPKWVLRTSDNETLLADAVCLALPAYAAARLLRSVDDGLASELDGISYASSATINLAYKREDIPHALDGFGFVVPFIENRSLMACTFSSVKFAGRAPEGYVLLRAFAGGALQPDMLDLTDAELISRIRSDLRLLLGIERAPLFTEISRWERSMPQYNLGHLERVNRIQERVSSRPQLTLAGGAYEGVGIPDCIRSGETAADVLIDAL